MSQTSGAFQLPLLSSKRHLKTCLQTLLYITTPLHKKNRFITEMDQLDEEKKKL